MASSRPFACRPAAFLAFEMSAWTREAAKVFLSSLRSATHCPTSLIIAGWSYTAKPRRIAQPGTFSTSARSIHRHAR